MKKALILILIIIVLLIIVGYALLPKIVLSMITEYDPYTFEFVLKDPVLREKYGIYQNSRPEDYGYESEEISFLSLDSTNLSGWYVPAKKASSYCLILVHGRTSNRLKTMKYLALIDTLKLDTVYNVFIPDFRNSGKSESSKTYMGYKFGEDVIASMLMLNKTYQQDTFFLYGFSMGAMAILNATGRKDLKKHYLDKDLLVEKIIFDSPLVNVRETLKDQATKTPIARPIFNEVFELYSSEIDGFGESMKLSKLLDPTIPTLILQSRADQTTKPDMLESELDFIKDYDQLHVTYHEGPGHVKMFQDELTKEYYINDVRRFILNTSRKPSKSR